MSRIPCPIDGCDLPAKSGYMCGACQAELQRALASVPGVLGDLDVTLSRQTSRMGRGGHGAAVPLAFDARASEAGWVLRNTLVGWVRIMQEGLIPGIGPVCLDCEHPSCRWIAYSHSEPANTPQSMAAWLSRGLERLVRHPAASEAHGEITTAVRAAQRVTDRAPERQFAGRCACGAALYAKPGAGKVQCRDCDAEPVDVGTQLDQMRDQVRDRLAHPTAAAALLARLEIKAPESTIRRWAAQGRILAHGTDPRGRNLYRIGDILDTITQMGRSLPA